MQTPITAWLTAAIAAITATGCATAHRPGETILPLHSAMEEWDCPFSNDHAEFFGDLMVDRNYEDSEVKAYASRCNLNTYQLEQLATFAARKEMAAARAAFTNPRIDRDERMRSSRWYS